MVFVATFALCDQGCALCHQIQGCDGQHTTQTLERVEPLAEERGDYERGEEVWVEPFPM
jgi:hypothetical protein